MANLIPPHAHKVLRREYLARVASVWLSLIAAAFFVVTLLFLPVYVLIESQTDAYAGDFERAEGRSDQFSSITKTITLSNTIASVLMTNDRPVAISDYLSVVGEAASDGITINQFTVSGSEPIQLAGTASTRTLLAAFKSELETSSHFERVELPISALASERNINFTMQLVPKNIE